MTVKMFCDGPDCEVVVLGGGPDWWLVQQLRETFHFHELLCLLAWASDAIAMAAMERGSAAVTGGGACSHPWHLRGPSRRNDGCPRCGTLAVTEPVPGT